MNVFFWFLVDFWKKKKKNNKGIGGLKNDFKNGKDEWRKELRIETLVFFW
jgi:hypothetical protein